MKFPWNKDPLNLSGYKWNVIRVLIAAQMGSRWFKEVTILYPDRWRSPATFEKGHVLTHSPPKKVTNRRIIRWSRVCLFLDRTLTCFFPIKKPKINVCSSKSGGEKHALFFPSFGVEFPWPLQKNGTENRNVHEVFVRWTWKYPSLPKSSEYLASRCVGPLKALSGGVCGSKHLLTRYLED